MSVNSPSIARVRAWYKAAAIKPAADGFVELVRHTVPAGKVLYADLRQFIGLAPGNAAVGFIDSTGLFDWAAFIIDPSGNNKTQVKLSEAQSTIGGCWIGGDPPIVRALRVPEKQILVWGANVTVAAWPAAIQGIGGSIEGWEIPVDMDPREVLPLLVG